MKTFITLAAVALLGGCVTIDSARVPENFPRLQERIVRASFVETQRVCKTGVMMQAFGCALLNFEEGTCTIYLATDDERVLEHERLHCRGHDHVGETTIQDHYASWKRSRMLAQQHTAELP